MGDVFGDDCTGADTLDKLIQPSYSTTCTPQLYTNLDEIKPLPNCTPPPPEYAGGHVTDTSN